MKIKAPKIMYSLKLSAIGLFKNRVMTVSSIFVLLSCLVIMGTFFLVIKNINYNIEKIDGFNKIVLFVDKEADEFETAEIGEKLKAIKDIESVEFESKEDALAEQVAQYTEAEFLLEMYKDNNPLKDSYVITYKPNADVETLRLNIERSIDHIAKLNVNMDVVNQIQNIKNAIAIIFTWLLILLFTVSLFIIINTIKLSVFSRRDEIALMRYIGATNFFVSTPYLIEGLAIGAISAGIAYGVQYVIYKYLMLELVDQYEIISILPFADVKGIVVIGFIAVGVITGFVGSLISLKKYNQENS
ncbi:MAG: permease-like cell division protein FtsX [Clostridia bacterium]|nr:permease-like cell division protein FtsX [Clostridia bacterium]